MHPHTIERLWYGDDILARSGRILALPASGVFRAASSLRNTLYNTGLATRFRPALPVVSVGNLTVGGTGKTPVSARLATMLSDQGATPAIVLRGYGDDEPDVHTMLNPGLQVVVDADRVRGVRRAAERGADIAVLDDAFQHRRVERSADLVLLSADRPIHPRYPLPAGPWREPLSSLRRASLAIITRKAAEDTAVEHAWDAIVRAAPGLPIAVAALQLGDLRLLPGRDPGPNSGAQRPLSALGGRRVLAVAALGDPAAFVSQLVARGADVDAMLYPDHYDFQEADVTTITRRARDSDITVCTLKDAVKLISLWPRTAPDVWYVTQTVHFERGENELRRILDRALERRGSTNRPGSRYLPGES